MLVLKNVTKSFGGIMATKDISMKLKPGSINAIIGPNGAGKTTLFNLITGKIKSDTGNIFIGNKNITSLSEVEITRLGIARAFQITNIFPTFTVKESIMAAILSKYSGLHNVWLRFKSHPVQEESENVAKITGLEKVLNIRGEELSHGDQKLLDIALALAMKPKILLLDEPTSGMGPEERRKMINKVKELWKKTKMTLVFIEHDMDIVFDVAQKVFVLQQGKILAEGLPKEIKKNQGVIDAYLGGGQKR